MQREYWQAVNELCDLTDPAKASLVADWDRALLDVFTAGQVAAFAKVVNSAKCPDDLRSIAGDVSASFNQAPVGKISRKFGEVFTPSASERPPVGHCFFVRDLLKMT